MNGHSLPLSVCTLSALVLEHLQRYADALEDHISLMRLCPKEAFPATGLRAFMDRLCAQLAVAQAQAQVLSLSDQPIE